jgi:hypothetical protein
VRCDVGLSCDSLSDSCVAVCERGAACGDDDDCDDAQMLSCILGRCDLLRGDGQPCGVDDDCTEGLRCEPNPMEPEIRVCTPKLTQGMPCPAFTGNADCATGWCNSTTGVCDQPKTPGSLCPDGDDAQCANGYCQTTFVSCTLDTDCAGSNQCNESFDRCEFYCVAFKADGSPCATGSECASGACVVDVCRTLPLVDGSECESSLQCESEFCSFETPRVCATLPLADGRGCSSPFQCESRICYNDTCNPGLGEGQPCDDFTLPPCAFDYYCDPSLDPPECVLRLDAGEECEGDFHCRGDCVSRFGRMICDGTPPLNAAMCDGE